MRREGSILEPSAMYVYSKLHSHSGTNERGKAHLNMEWNHYLQHFSPQKNKKRDLFKK